MRCPSSVAALRRVDSEPGVSVAAKALGVAAQGN